ncbi:Ethylene-responsive nuclear / ethylene-regulated nuclear protein (ERT2)-like protein [Quillaja saponaria]|uniref:Ethylene-responsive nuclear / ethylene-regulated nuclear protein (ERT2)-like protein n=1 Tax=Quillaja saponaria TaxID=32244 RepID=A0AAD7KWK6_QUISA|nr:Ethylene-responsive nuclear / ethylene-regulated nuclear protein (ERT2)-like protein [Quillaja saponaria]
MPFPWKKNKVNRISQIVADLQSPNRGGSLVVETGFPTSLIDLFVKNSDRFKKPKTEKWVQVEISDPVNLTTPSPPSPPPPPPPSTPLNTNNLMVVRAEPGCTVVQSSSSRRPVGEDVDGGDGVEDQNRVENCVGGSDASSVFVLVLKIFVVVVLALCTKKFTVGITMSAFVLLFLEYAGKRIVYWLNLKTWLDANTELKSLSRRVFKFDCLEKLVFVWKKIKNFEGSEKPPLVVSGLVCGAELCSSSSSSSEETEIVETKFETEIEILENEFCREFEIMETKDNNSSWSELDFHDKDKRCSCLELEDSQEKVGEDGKISLSKIKGARRAKLKAKIKKFVPKKLQGSKKENKNRGREAESRRESSNNMEEDKLGRFEKDEESWNRSSYALPSEQRCEEEEDAEVDDGTACSSGSSLVGVEVAWNVEKEDTDRDGNWGYLFLFLIVLAGLVGGRVIALLLTVAWCFILKMFGKRDCSEKSVLQVFNRSVGKTT